MRVEASLHLLQAGLVVTSLLAAARRLSSQHLLQTRHFACHCLLLPGMYAPSSCSRLGLCLHRCLLLRAGYEQLVKYLMTPPGSASALSHHAGAAISLSASAFLVPLTLQHFPANTTSKQAAAFPAATPGRRLQEPPIVSLANFYSTACKGPAASFLPRMC